MRTSVLIITKDRPKLLSSCAESISQSQCVPDEMIVVDGSNNKNLVIQKEEFSKKIHLVYKHYAGVGIPQARNIAVKIARGDALFFLDDDCQIFPDTLKILLDCLKANNAAAVFGRIVNGNSTNIPSCVQQAYYDLWVEKITGNKSRSGLPLRGFIPGLDLAVFRRKILLENPFQEDFPFGVDEDIEFGARLSSRGVKLYYCSSICARHFGKKSVFALMKRNFVTGYANEFTKTQYGVDVKRAIIQASHKSMLKSVKQNTASLSIFSSIAFWVLFMIYPLSSRFGRLAYLGRHTIEK